MLPGELDPKGFMAWERTWLLPSPRVLSCPLEIERKKKFASTTSLRRLSTLPKNANRVAAVPRTPTTTKLTLTPEEDAAFRPTRPANEPPAIPCAPIYGFRCARARSHLVHPAHLNCCPSPATFSPLRSMHEEGPPGPSASLSSFSSSTFCYVALGLWGGWPPLEILLPARPPRAAPRSSLLYPRSFRTAFLTNSRNSPEAPLRGSFASPPLIAPGRPELPPHAPPLLPNQQTGTLLRGHTLVRRWGRQSAQPPGACYPRQFPA